MDLYILEKNVLFFFTLGIDVSDIVEVEYEPDEDTVIEV